MREKAGVHLKLRSKGGCLPQTCSGPPLSSKSSKTIIFESLNNIIYLKGKSLLL